MEAAPEQGGPQVALEQAGREMLEVQQAPFLVEEAVLEPQAPMGQQVRQEQVELGVPLIRPGVWQLIVAKILAAHTITQEEGEEEDRERPPKITVASEEAHLEVVVEQEHSQQMALQTQVVVAVVGIMLAAEIMRREETAGQEFALCAIRIRFLPPQVRLAPLALMFLAVIGITNLLVVEV